MKIIKNVLINLTVAAVSIVLVFGGLEFSYRTFASERVSTYFDEQTEKALGKPVPKKGKDEYRIFIFGGSSAYGFPVSDRFSIAAWLRKSFPHLLPQKKVTVINCAWPGKSSHHVLEGARTVLKYKPDLFIIFEGHNDVTVSNRLYLDNWLYWLNFRIFYASHAYQYLHKRLSRMRKKLVYGRAGHVEKQHREEVIAQKVYKEEGFDEAEYDRILNRWAKNMESVVKIAERNAISVMFLSMPSNIRDIPPAQSSHRSDLSPAQLQSWKLLFNEGGKYEKEGKWKEALKSFQMAAGIDPTYAGLQYYMGRVYEGLGKYEKAKEHYVLARDLDRLSIRSKTKLNSRMKEIVDKNNLPFVDVVGILEKVSPNGIISSELIYDDVHPTVVAQQMITDQILRELWQKGEVDPSSEWYWEKLKEAKQGEEWKVDGGVDGYRYVLQGLYLWEHDYCKEAIPELKKSLEKMPSFIDSYAFLGDCYMRTDNKKKAAESFNKLKSENKEHFDKLIEKYPQLKESYSRSID